MSVESDAAAVVVAPVTASAERAMRFPAWRESSAPDPDGIPNTTVIGEVVRLVTVPYAGTEAPTSVIIRPPLTDYVERPVDV